MKLQPVHHFLFFISFVAVLLAEGSSVRSQTSEAQSQPSNVDNSHDSLTTAVAGRFQIGAGISDRIATQPQNWPLLLQQYSIVTPENSMKPQGIQTKLGQYNFDLPDQFVRFAVERKLQVVGHCLVWAKDDRTHDWYFKDGESIATKEVLLDRIRTDIRTIVGRYRGKIAMWDVVNEALADGESDYLRPSGFVSATGDEYIAAAFRAAHEADPQALLIYNDYNNEQPIKRAKMLKLLESLLQAQVPIHAVGLQGHFELDKIPLQDLEDTIVAVKKLGLKVVVSELDIDMVPRGRWWAEGGKYRDELSKLNPYKEGCPEELLKRQAEQYADLFRLFTKHSDSILRVSFWNLHDGESWLNYFPWNRVNYPLLFDRNRAAKPAFHSVMNVLEQSNRAGSN